MKPEGHDAPPISELGHFAATHTPAEMCTIDELSQAFETSPLSTSQRLASFPRHVRRQEVARFLTRYELFKNTLTVNGSIAECGVYMGAGLISWLHFSSILEPYNHTRKIIGFDTFAGFPVIDDADVTKGPSEHHKTGGFQTHHAIKEEIQRLIDAHDKNRPLGHIPKVELVVGDASETIPAYARENKHVMLSLLYLDFDLYQPTKAALEHLLPRVVKGGIVAFDELNCRNFPGETEALLEVLDLSSIQLQRSPIDSYTSWFVK